MTAYIIRRLFYTIPVVLGVTVIVFFLFNIVGGDPTSMMLGKNPKPRDVRDLERKYDLDKPLFININAFRAHDGAVARALKRASHLEGNARDEALRDLFDRGLPAVPALAAAATRDFSKQRRIAAALLAERFGPRPAFDPEAPPEARDKALEPWRNWWESARSLHPFPPFDAVVWGWLDDAAGSEPGEAERARARLRDAGAFAVPALATAVIEGDGLRRSIAAGVLSEMTGFAATVEPGTPEVEREKAVDRWEKWREEEGTRYRYSFLGRLGSLFDSQFFRFLANAAVLDFGRSFKNKQKISHMIRDGIVPSLTLSVPAFFLGLLAGLYISLLCAFYRNTWLDRGIVVLSVLGMSLSSLIYIIAAQYFLAYRFNWFPVWGYEPGLASTTYLILPVFIWILVAIGSDVRFNRTVILDEINQDYVRTARAKGLSQNVVLFKHVLKNAMIPVITRTVIAIPFLYTGSLLLERFFGIPGLGNMLVEAVNNSDLFVVRAMTYIGAILYVVGNLVTDLCYALVDPRIRLR